MNSQMSLKVDPAMIKTLCEPQVRLRILLALVLLIIPCLPALAEAPNPRVLLQQLIADLQNSPNDQMLREKIIKLALTLDPAPAIPQEAERFMARGQAAMEIAQEPGDFKDAAEEFEKAALAAPWLGNVYYNLGIVQDKAGDYPAAIRNLKLYLLATPDASDAKAVETLIYKVEFKQEKAAKASNPEVVATRERQEEEDFIKMLNGARYIRDDNTSLVEIRGTEVVFSEVYAYDNRWHAIASAPVSGPGREIKLTSYEGVSGLDVILIISPDGDSVRLKFPSLQGLRKDLILQREK